MKIKLLTFHIVTLIILLGCFSNSYSQNNQPGDIITDRPDQTESPSTLPSGFVQIETGVSYEKFTLETDDSSPVKLKRETILYPTVLVRIGVLDNFEFRISTNIQNEKFKLDILPSYSVVDTSETGVTPLTLGAKIKITDETDKMPASAFLFHVDIPKLASEEFQPLNPTPEFRFALAKQLSDRFSLGLNFGAEFSIDNNQTTGLYTLALGMNIINNLASYVEVYGFFGKGLKNHNVDGGLTYLVSKNIQLDASGSVGLSENSPDFSIGGGLSIRLPR